MAGQTLPQYGKGILRAGGRGNRGYCLRSRGSTGSSRSLTGRSFRRDRFGLHGGSLRRRLRRSFAGALALQRLDEITAVRPAHFHQTRLAELLDEFQERSGAEVALAERSIKLQQGAFQQAELGGNL